MKKGFIIGNPRSGTSLFRIMLNGHPDIVSPPESGFLHWWHNKYREWNKNNNNEQDIDAFISDLLQSKKIEGLNLDFERIKYILLKNKPTDYSSLMCSVYMTYAELRGKKPSIIADKNNYYIKHLDDLHAIWPDAFYIMVVRDGRDVACSYLNIKKLETSSPYKPILSSEIDLIAKEWKENNERMRLFLKGKNHIVVRYEDLVLDCVGELKKVCGFFEIPYDEKMSQYHEIGAEQHDEPVSTIDWKRKTFEKPDPLNIGKYKTELNNESIVLFNNIAGDYLRIYDYDV